MELNEQQKKAVNHVDGPCLITACPGSGKTRTIVERTISLIKSGIPQENILCLTFTNKAGREMSNRIKEALGLDKLGFYVGTFHTFCATILRKYGSAIGYTSSYTIFDDDDQETTIKKIIRDMDIDKNSVNVYDITLAVNHYRENLETEEDLFIRLKEDDISLQIAKRYLEVLKEHNCIDFSGLLYEVVRLFDTDKVLLEKYQEKLKYIQVDEMQDTNYIQFHILNMIGDKYRNIAIVGDINQCVVEGTNISTKNGETPVETLKVGDKILSGSGRNKVKECVINNIYKNKYKGDIIEVETFSGRKLLTTPEHTYFSEFTKMGEMKNMYFTYLMYKKEYGFRVGMTRRYDSRSSEGHHMGFKMRTNQEIADKLWILESVDNEWEARYWEEYYSVKFGLPTWVFKTRDSKKSRTYDQKTIDMLFKNIDTHKGGMSLLKHKNMDFDKPHHTPKCMSKRRRRNFSVILCTDGRQNSIYHSYSISGSDSDDEEKINRIGIKTRKAKNGKGWRVEGSSADVGKIYTIMEKVSKEVDLNVIEKARLREGNALSFTPASNLCYGMSIFVYDKEKNEVVLDTIRSVKRSSYDGFVYDIDIDLLHNFSANGIFTHNSIYKFRGSRYQNILDFLDRYKDCVKIPLEKNYRSTPEIVKVADKLIRNNKSHMGDIFETDNPSGSDVSCSCFENPQEEAMNIASEIKYMVRDCGWNYSEIAILYRINSLSMDLQMALSNAQIPFTVVGGPSFFDRAEIKDCLSMLKFLSNPDDHISFARIAKLFNGVGNATIQKIENLSKENKLNITEVCKNIDKYSDKNTIKKAAEKIKEAVGFDYAKLHPGDCLSFMIEKLDYNNVIEMKYPKDYQDRANNIKELINNATAFGQRSKSIEKYLQNIALVSSSDKETEEGSVTLMTCHAAKGTEHEIVFVCGINEGIVPHALAVSECGDDLEKRAEAIEEERRCLFVALTRAKKHLFCSFTKTKKIRDNSGYFRTIVQKPSQFLYECGLLKKK